MFSLNFSKINNPRSEAIPSSRSLLNVSKWVEKKNKGVQKLHPLLTTRKVKFYYEVVKSAILPLAASFLETRVYSTSNCFFSASPVFAKSCTWKGLK